MEEWKKRIIEIRRINGVGYRTIAREIEESRDKVRDYCISVGLNGYARSGLDKAAVEKVEAETYVCLYCGETCIQPKTGRRRKFCSDQCRRAFHKKHPERVKPTLYLYVCQMCGRRFLSSANNRKYCSHGCYVKHRFNK